MSMWRTTSVGEDLLVNYFPKTKNKHYEINYNLAIVETSYAYLSTELMTMCLRDGYHLLH